MAKKKAQELLELTGVPRTRMEATELGKLFEQIIQTAQLRSDLSTTTEDLGIPPTILTPTPSHPQDIPSREGRQRQSNLLRTKSLDRDRGTGKDANAVTQVFQVKLQRDRKMVMHEQENSRYAAEAVLLPPPMATPMTNQSEEWPEVNVVFPSHLDLSDSVVQARTSTDFCCAFASPELRFLDAVQRCHARHTVNKSEFLTLKDLGLLGTTALVPYVSASWCEIPWDPPLAANFQGEYPELQVPKGINIMCQTKDGRVSFEVATMIEAHQRALNKKIQVYVVWAPPHFTAVHFTV